MTAVSKVNPETNSLLYRGYPVPTDSWHRKLRRDLFGISFNTSIGGESIFNGLSLAGELSYRPDTPIALGLNEYLPTALLNPDGLPVGTRLDGYREKDMYQASLVGIYNFTGVLGAVLAPWVLDRLRVRDPRVRGLAIGVSSHGIGTARALAEGPKTGAFSALAMACSGVLTALLAPLVLAMTG